MRSILHRTHLLIDSSKKELMGLIKFFIVVERR